METPSIQAKTRTERTTVREYQERVRMCKMWRAVGKSRCGIN